MHRSFRLLIFTAALVLCAAASAVDAPPKTTNFWVYLGTYTGGKSKGIYRCSFDAATGKLGEPILAAETPNPSFLALDPKNHSLYAVNENSGPGDKGRGTITAFALAASSGALKELNQKPSQGTLPCYLTVDQEGKHVLLANYGSGSVTVYRREEDGRLGERTSFVQHLGKGADRARQEGPHAHSIDLDSANRFACVADLGLDRVIVYRYDPIKGELDRNDPPAMKLPAKSGPRHFAFHPDGRHAYVINEMASTVAALNYDPAKGILTLVQTISTLPRGFRKPTTTAEVQVHPSGKFLYGSNRGHNSIAIFTIDEKTGELTPAGHQTEGINVPRNFGIDPTGAFMLVANQEGDDVLVFRINAQTGALQATGEKVRVGQPVCVKFVPRSDEKE